MIYKILDIKGKHSKELNQLIKDLGHNLDSLKLSEVEANSLNEKLLELSHQLKADFILIKENLLLKKKKLIIFDMDATLIKNEVIDQLAEAHGVDHEVKKITVQAMGGQMDFKESLALRVSFLKGFSQNKMQSVFETLSLSDGIEELFVLLKKNGIKTAIASGGFTYFASQFQKQLGMDEMFANELEFKDGALTGKVTGPIVDAERKKDIVHELAKKYHLELDEIMTVGDGANDIPMLLEAGVGVAVHAKPKVQAQVKFRLNYDDMKALRYILNI